MINWIDNEISPSLAIFSEMCCFKARKRISASVDSWRILLPPPSLFFTHWLTVVTDTFFPFCLPSPPSSSPPCGPSGQAEGVHTEELDNDLGMTSRLWQKCTITRCHAQFTCNWFDSPWASNARWHTKWNIFPKCFQIYLSSTLLLGSP